MLVDGVEHDLRRQPELNVEVSFQISVEIVVPFLKVDDVDGLRAVFVVIPPYCLLPVVNVFASIHVAVALLAQLDAELRGTFVEKVKELFGLFLVLLAVVGKNNDEILKLKVFVKLSPDVELATSSNFSSFPLTDAQSRSGHLD